MMTEKTGAVPQIIQRVRIYLRNHYQGKNTLEDLGVHFSINPCYLHSIIFCVIFVNYPLQMRQSIYIMDYGPLLYIDTV